MSSRLGLRFLNSFRQPLSSTTSTIRTSQSSSIKSTFAKRAGYATESSTASGAAGAAAAAAGATESKFSQFLNSKVGPKTVHFWAPIMKWGLVIAGAADFARPASDLSLSQNAALACTGTIWTRWCFIIKPRNIFLASVNFAVACVALTQVTRILIWRRSQNGSEASVAETAGRAAEGEAAVAKAIVQDPKAAVNKAKNV